MSSIPGICLDGFRLDRLDLLELDVEGMEIAVLESASQTLATLKPILVVEHLQVHREALQDRLIDSGYRVYEAGINLPAIHLDDPTLTAIAEAWGSSLDHSRDRVRVPKVKPRRSPRA